MIFFLGYLGFPGLVLVLFFAVPVVSFVIQRKWRATDSRRRELKRLVALASEEAAGAEAELLNGPLLVPIATEFRCYICYSPSNTRCARCKGFRYCSGKCQIIHWRRGHKEDCKPISTTIELNGKSRFPNQKSASIGTQLGVYGNRFESKGRSYAKPVVAFSGESVPSRARLSPKCNVRKDGRVKNWVDDELLVDFSASKVPSASNEFVSKGFLSDDSSSDVVETTVDANDTEVHRTIPSKLSLYQKAPSYSREVNEHGSTSSLGSSFRSYDEYSISGTPMTPSFCWESTRKLDHSQTDVQSDSARFSFSDGGNSIFSDSSSHLSPKIDLSHRSAPPNIAFKPKSFLSDDVYPTNLGSEMPGYDTLRLNKTDSYLTSMDSKIPAYGTTQSKKFHCHICDTPSVAHSCQCKVFHYCSGKCQIIHWREGHREDCKPRSTMVDINGKRRLPNQKSDSHGTQHGVYGVDLEGMGRSYTKPVITFTEDSISSKASFSPKSFSRKCDGRVKDWVDNQPLTEFSVANVPFASTVYEPEISLSDDHASDVFVTTVDAVDTELHRSRPYNFSGLVTSENSFAFSGKLHHNAPSYSTRVTERSSTSSLCSSINSLDKYAASEPSLAPYDLWERNHNLSHSQNDGPDITQLNFSDGGDSILSDTGSHLFFKFDRSHLPAPNFSFEPKCFLSDDVYLPNLENNMPGYGTSQSKNIGTCTTTVEHKLHAFGTALSEKIDTRGFSNNSSASTGRHSPSSMKSSKVDILRTGHAGLSEIACPSSSASRSLNIAERKVVELPRRYAVGFVSDGIDRSHCIKEFDAYSAGLENKVPTYGADSMKKVAAAAAAIKTFPLFCPDKLVPLDEDNTNKSQHLSRHTSSNCDSSSSRHSTSSSKCSKVNSVLAVPTGLSKNVNSQNGSNSLKTTECRSFEQFEVSKLSKGDQIEFNEVDAHPTIFDKKIHAYGTDRTKKTCPEESKVRISPVCSLDLSAPVGEDYTDASQFLGFKGTRPLCSSFSDGESSSTTRRQSASHVKPSKVNSVHKWATSLSRAVSPSPIARNGLKMSLRKVAEQFRVPKLSKPFGFGSEVAGYKMLFPYELFVKLYNWDKVEMRPCGLTNCGNSCYANTVLQCVAFTRPLTAYLLQGLHSKTCPKKGWCFTCNYESLILKASKGITPLSPLSVLSQIQSIGSQLGNGKEEDAHEFLRYVLNIMQSVCLKETGVNAMSPLLEETTLVELTFGGYLRSEIKCMRCHGRTERQERMMDLTLEIQGGIRTLEEALKKFTASKILDGENKYMCHRCKSSEKAKKKLTVLEAPNIFTIALKRLQTSNPRRGYSSVHFPETLNLAPYMSGTTDKSPSYSLYAVVVHLDIKNAASSGHYVCYVKNIQEKWFEIDDIRVKLVNLEKVLSARAYMLFYARCSPRCPSLAQKEMKNAQRKTKKHLKETSSIHSKNGTTKVEPLRSISAPARRRPEDYPYWMTLDGPSSFDSFDSFDRRFLQMHRSHPKVEASSDNCSLSSYSDEGSCSTDSTRDTTRMDFSDIVLEEGSFNSNSSQSVLQDSGGSSSTFLSRNSRPGRTLGSSKTSARPEYGGAHAVKIDSVRTRVPRVGNRREVLHKENNSQMYYNTSRHHRTLSRHASSKRQEDNSE